MTGNQRKVLIVSFLVLFSIYAFLALIAFDVGIVGDVIANSFFRAFGIGAYAFPFLLFYYAFEIARFQKSARFRSIGRIVGFSGWFFIFLTLSQWRASESGYSLETGPFGGFTGDVLFRTANLYLGETGMILTLFLLSFLSTFAVGEGKWVHRTVLFFKRSPDFLTHLPIINRKKDYIPSHVPLAFSPPHTKAEEQEEITDTLMDESVEEKLEEHFDPEDLGVQSKKGFSPKVVIAPSPKEDGRKPVPRKRKRSAVGGWRIPGSEILNPYQKKVERVTTEEVNRGIVRLEKTLSEFNVAGKVINVMVGPTITRYEFQPAPGVKVNKVVGLSNDIALSFAAAAVRIEAPIPGKSAVGIEIPNENKEMVVFRELVESRSFSKSHSPLVIALGKDVTGKHLAWDLKNAPHLLIAGATGSGKSVCINSILGSLLYRADPNQLRIALIDPKKVELSLYSDLPHLCAPVISDVRWVVKFLKWMCREMDSRYQLLSDLGTRNIEEYNNVMESNEKLPYVVVIIDELADLMMTAPSDVEAYICRLAQMARAVGIHLILATQRPSVDVITGLIKANFPSRIAFAVSSQADSKTILDGTGAEKLLGNGDLLFSPVGVNKALRGQGAYISTAETKKIIDHWARQEGEIFYPMEFILKDEPEEDFDEEEELYQEAVSIVLDHGKASTSLLQRRLRIGFNRAARLIEKMERDGIVGPYEGSKPRKVMVNNKGEGFS